MNKRTPQSLIQGLLKQSDMASQPGTVNVKNRGLDFHVFDRNKFRQRLSKLPEVVKDSIERQMAEFDRAFAQFPAAQSRDYAGMLRIAYAEDRLVSEERLNELSREAPTLVETAKFVREFGIQLPPDMGGTVNGKAVEKGIGSHHWLSIFGYAYQALGNRGLDYHVAQKRNKIPRQIHENVSGKQYPRSVNGTFQVVPAGEGFTFAIVSDGGITYIFDKTVTSNSTIMKKFFNEPIIMDRSAVYVTPDSINYIGNADATIQADPTQEARIWGIFADPDNGAFYLQKKSRYGAGGRPSIDPETGEKVQRTKGDKQYLSFEQVTSLANRNTLGKTYRVTAQIDQDGVGNQGDGEVDAQEVASGYKYVYLIDDENTLNKIHNPQTKDEFPYSISALKQLRKWLQMKNSTTEFDERGRIVPSDEELHTSLEGFIVYMAGPDFTTGRNAGQGKTLGNPNMTQYKDLPEGNLEQEGNSVITNRQTFVVVAKQISIPRMMASERYYENKFAEKKIVMSPWREVRSGLATLADAISEMKRIIVGNGGKIVEDEEGKAVAVDPLARLQPDARSVQKAAQAFKQFVGNREAPQQQPPQQAPQLPEGQDNPDIRMASIARDLIRRLNSNV